jgi:hypothetical protein
LKDQIGRSTLLDVAKPNGKNQITIEQRRKAIKIIHKQANTRYRNNQTTNK